ncbi:MAG: hypothetical protein IPI23_00990 [Bacteroidetes bacterium]|nr:hypothetical protein [Bacteroidota bacterium]
MELKRVYRLLYPVLPRAVTLPGATTVCQGSTQSYSASCSNATSYNWSVPIGWTITSGQGTSSINVTVGANSGQVCVTPSNSCGNGTQTCVSVTVSITPSCSGGMSGLVSVCEFSSQNYSVSCVDANSYNWTIPSGWTINSGQGTSSLNVSTGSNSGQVCVTPSNNCGNGAQICLSVISETTPSQPSTIVGDTIVCQFDTVTYLVNAVPGATSYNWGITVGTFLSGTNTDSIIVICSNIGIRTIQSVAINNCGTRVQQT